MSGLFVGVVGTSQIGTAPTVGIEPATFRFLAQHLNPSTPNDPYMGRTALLTTKRYSLYIYSTNTGTEYSKLSVFFSLQNAVRFIILTYLVPVLFTFYIKGVLKLKNKIPASKG
jgi:hypothetical protein